MNPSNFPSETVTIGGNISTEYQNFSLFEDGFNLNIEYFENIQMTGSMELNRLTRHVELNRLNILK